ncbi:hypothetical protein [Anaerotignum sp.]|uniref:hypothetical protein n=1 Tax=Anaerotignum sp. TaxID=2039241 RepID=UPI0028A81EB8|nr:hypothetical protein [Anaerotignum sp.]
MIDRDGLQKKLDKLPNSFRRGIRGGFIFITWLPICFSDAMSIFLAVGHILVVSFLLYNNLDLRSDPDQTLRAYRNYLYLELLMCVLIILIVLI